MWSLLACGSTSHAQDHMRSIPFEKLMPLMDNPYYSWFSLQVDDFSKDIQKYGAEELINDPSKDILRDGWPRTGVILLNLDLLITVDTAVAHLAGTLDVPCWLLVPKSSSWIWKRYGKTTAWYPSITIFRQKTAGNWDSVIKEVHQELDKIRIDNTEYDQRSVIYKMYDKFEGDFIENSQGLDG